MPLVSGRLIEFQKACGEAVRGTRVCLLFCIGSAGKIPHGTLDPLRAVLVKMMFFYSLRTLHSSFRGLYHCESHLD